MGALPTRGSPNLAHLRNLEYLNLATGDNSFPPLATDSRLKCIAGMGSLTDLRLAGPGVTDAGLAHLRGAKANQPFARRDQY